MARPVFGIGMEVYVTRNDLVPTANQIEDGGRRITEISARRIAELWSGDVRVDTKKYRDSIKPHQVNQWAWTVDTDVTYAWFNEYGSITIDARPSMRMALSQAADEADAMLGALL